MTTGDAMMLAHGRCRKRSAENDCGAKGNFGFAQHFRISSLSIRGLTQNGLTSCKKKAPTLGRKRQRSPNGLIVLIHTQVTNLGGGTDEVSTFCARHYCCGSDFRVGRRLRPFLRPCTAFLATRPRSCMSANMVPSVVSIFLIIAGERFALNRSPGFLSVGIGGELPARRSSSN
jgi:hypothetical protein